MKRYYIKTLLLLVLLIKLGLLSSFAQTKNKVNNIFELKGDNGLVLKISIDYYVTKKKILANNKFVEYTVTNISNASYDGTANEKYNSIVFDLITKDGVTIEKIVSFREKLYPGKSTVIKYLIPDVGPKRYCVDVKASRLDFSSPD